jgi:transcriptional regulator NrdR family protein
MKCPQCGSENTRPSRKETRMDFIDEWRGRQRLRCRDCRHSFHTHLPANELQKIKKAEAIRKKRKKGWAGLVQNPSQRRAVEVLVFFGMLLVFYLAFNSLVSKDGSGVFSRPPAEAQP